MYELPILSALCTLAIMLVSATVDAGLVGRLPATPGGTDYQAYYDDQLDITWLADANLGATNTFGLPNEVYFEPHPLDSSGYDAWIQYGRMNWPGALHWIDAMNAYGGTGYLGFSDWRLPNMDVSGDGVIPVTCNANQLECKDNELAHLFYYGAGTTLDEGITQSNPGPFSNLQNFYWSSTESYFHPDDVAWEFFLQAGGSLEMGKTADNNVWAVRAGDVSAVPVPAAMWLFGSSLIGLIGIARRKNV